MTAQREEIIVYTHSFQVQYLAPDGSYLLFKRCLWCLVTSFPLKVAPLWSR